MNLNTIGLLKKFSTDTTILELSGYGIEGILDLGNFPVLETLVCVNNTITIITNIPESIKKINCDNNLIMRLEITPLHTNLIKLSCVNNKFEFLTELPESLESISCADNSNLKCLIIPKNTCFVSCCSNINLEVLVFESEIVKILLCSKNPKLHLDTVPDSIETLDIVNSPNIKLKHQPANIKEFFHGIEEEKCSSINDSETNYEEYNYDENE